jgi:hypothetical protein
MVFATNQIEHNGMTTGWLAIMCCPHCFTVHCHIWFNTFQRFKQPLASAAKMPSMSSTHQEQEQQQPTWQTFKRFKQPSASAAKAPSMSSTHQEEESDNNQHGRHNIKHPVLKVRM